MTQPDNIKLAKASSAKARRSAARLAAVQAVYQMSGNEQSAASVVEEFMARRLGKPVDGQDMVLPDGILFTAIVKGVGARVHDLSPLVDGTLARGREPADDPKIAAREPLLYALLLCGAYELLAEPETDTPVIVSDYVNVAHAFFEAGEAKLVNAVLDRIGKNLRGTGDTANDTGDAS